MNHETYENILRVAEKRKRQATMRGDWSAVSETSMEIVLLEKAFKETQNMKKGE